MMKWLVVLFLFQITKNQIKIRSKKEQQKILHTTPTQVGPTVSQYPANGKPTESSAVSETENEEKMQNRACAHKRRKKLPQK